MREPVELSYAQCLDLLAAGGVGRAAVSTPQGPHIVPVNYAVVADSVVFRTTPWSVLGSQPAGTLMAFEVDVTDHDRQLGWSVVARGRSGVVDDPDDLLAVRAFWDPRPWAGGERPVYVRLRWQELSGRRIGPVSAARTPVRRVL